jgi:hypothetical protein
MRLHGFLYRDFFGAVFRRAEHSTGVPGALINDKTEAMRKKSAAFM